MYKEHNITTQCVQAGSLRFSGESNLPNLPPCLVSFAVFFSHSPSTASSIVKEKNYLIIDV